MKQLNTDDNKLNTIDTSDNKSDIAKTWFSNENTNNINLKFKKKSYNNIDEKDLEEK